MDKFEKTARCICCKMLGQKEQLHSNELTLSMKGFCTLEVISNICLETKWHINKSKQGKQNNNNSIDHSAAALDGGENSQ